MIINTGTQTFPMATVTVATAISTTLARSQPIMTRRRSQRYDQDPP